MDYTNIPHGLHSLEGEYLPSSVPDSEFLSAFQELAYAQFSRSPVEVRMIS